MLRKPFILGKKIKQIGIQRAAYVALHRCANFFYSNTTRSCLWNTISHLYKQKKIKWVFQSSMFDEFDIQRADRITEGWFEVLGSGPIKYNKQIWHTDIRLQNQRSNADCFFDQTTFYKDITIEYGKTDLLKRDIKVPWELSRFLFAPQLGYAYHKTADKKYVNAFEKYITDWLETNSYLYGINWVNPMEIAIRSINWILALQFFDSALSSELHQKIICSLYDHMLFLEHHWELADGRTSNHYLSDLVGYLYLAWFFSDDKKVAWAVNRIEQEMAWQVFDEGTSYEGSTSYHKLVTELFEHARLMAQECEISFSKSFISKLNKMKQFVNRCRFGMNEFIRIGDDDSGIISACSVLQTQHQAGLFHYNDFGITLVKNNNWHISVRHDAYHERQPTGHFHHDAGSITLAFNGIPILIDPGSYVYTASSYWRNYFRSHKVHNTVYSDDDTIEESELFTLNLKPEKNKGNCLERDGRYVIESHYHVDHQHAITNYRKVECDTLNNEIVISDQLKSNVTEKKVWWNFTFAPNIGLEKSKNGWLLFHNDTQLLRMNSTMVFEVVKGWDAPRYGVKVPTYQLQAATMITNPIEKFIIRFLH